MKKQLYLFVLASLFFPAFLFSQSSDELSPRERRNLKKEERKQQQQEAIASLNDLLDSQQWVLEAYQILDRFGRNYFVQPNINFLVVDQQIGFLQTGSNNRIGRNGLGGFTLEGRVQHTELNKGDQKNAPFLTFRFQGRGGLGNSQIRMTVTSSGIARATINTDFGGRFTLVGQLVPLEESIVYRGITLF